MTADAHAGGTRDDEVQEAIRRYRRATEETLEQLDWCVDYLYRIGKPGIARTIRQNRATIHGRIRPRED